MEAMTHYVSVKGRSFIVRPPATPEEHIELMELERLIWGSDYRDVVPYHITIPLAEMGGVVLGVYEVGIGKAVGVLVMFPAISEGKVHYHSHILGFLKEYRGQGLGTKIKEIQRMISIQRGIDLITWTFDPLLLSNAWLNIVKMGVVVKEYRINYYGVGAFEYNRGVETDRFMAEWHLKSERVKRRLDKGELKVQTLSHYINDVGAEIVLDADIVDGYLKPGKPKLTSRNDVLLVRIPDNFVKILTSSLSLANEWRLKSRLALRHYLLRKYVVIDITADESRERYYYVMWKNGYERALEGELP